MSEPTIRRLTEAAGAARGQLEDGLVEDLETAALDPRAAPVVVPDTVPVATGAVLHLSIDGAMIPLVGGVWAEARTLVRGRVAVDARTVRTTTLSSSSHVTSAAVFSRLAMAALTRRGIPGLRLRRRVFGACRPGRVRTGHERDERVVRNAAP